MRQDVLWMIKDRAGMQQRVDVKNVVFGHGPRPHGMYPPFVDEAQVARAELTRGIQL